MSFSISGSRAFNVLIKVDLFWLLINGKAFSAYIGNWFVGLFFSRSFSKANAAAAYFFVAQSLIRIPTQWSFVITEPLSATSIIFVSYFIF